MINNKQGFTLLELLIAILVIGILVAMVVPQYKLASDRAFFANLQNMAISIKKAYITYYMRTDTHPNKFSQLEITLPDNFVISQSNYKGVLYECGADDKMFCCVLPYTGGATRGSIFCGKKDKSFIYSTAFFHYNGGGIPTDMEACYVRKDDKYANHLCNVMGFNKKEYSGTSVVFGGPSSVPYQYWLKQ